MITVRIISIILILLGIFFAILITFITRNNNNKPVEDNSKHNFCILIPARYESRVIEKLLKSISEQSYKINMENVYVIVESLKDETVNISKKYNATVFVRKKIELQRKGYALDEAVKHILSLNKHYDAYFIFDADNVLDKDYIKNMLPIFDKGYDLASGYRNCKNGNSSVVAAASALTFSLINTVFNKQKNKQTRNITFSGTGFYIRGKIIDELGGYPFHELTEDYELSLYATLNNLTTYYNINSKFYDEQPTKYKDTINQRQRWIRGYFDSRKKYVPMLKKSLALKDKNFGSKLDETFGISYYIFIIVGAVIWILALLVNIGLNFILNIKDTGLIYELIMILLIIYMILFSMTFVMIILEKKEINLSTKMKIKVLFYNPFFMSSYLFCAIKALTKKEVTWKVVEHKEN